MKHGGGRFGSRHGQAALFVALHLTVMFALMGFVVDLSFGWYKKHAQQAAADSAAMAAAAWAAANGSSCSSGITCNVTTNCTIPSSVTTPFGAGCVYAQANGYTNGGGSGGTQTVTMLANNTNSPVSGNSPSLWFQATVGDSYSTMFGRFGGINSLSIKATAIAGVSTTGGGSCIIALSESGTGFTDSGSGNVTTTSCGIYDNSGFSYSGSGNITTSVTDYAGTYSNTGAGNLSPTPTKITSYVSDPFADVTEPTVSTTCNQTNYSYSGSSNTVLSPGVYCGGLAISGSGNVTFNTGTYIINGTDSGGKSFDYSGSGNLSGTNVTFFITGQNGYTAGPVNISGSGNLTFSAPSSGTYQGILFFQDRNVSYASANTYSGSGNVTGTFYFPTTSLTYSGSGNNLYQALVANKITYSGSGNITLVKDTTGQYTGLVQTTSALLQ